PISAPAAGPASAASAAGAAVTAQASAPGAAVLARALAQAVDASGLFYESHLAGLAFGRRTLAQLRNEPQAGLPAGTPNAQASVPAAARAQAGPAGTPGQAPGLPADAPARGEAAPPSGGPAAGGTPWPAAPAQGGVHPEASLLVRQQLEVLANQALAWRGEPWPDAQMHWEIRRETQQPEQPDPQAGWDTRLVLELPRLGKVQATLRLQGNQLLMRLSAEHSASLLQAESATLRERYAAAGFELVGLAVDRDAPPVPPGEAGP
ncbi:flagellar hook-length control protein FliK, partial [Orrella sp. JC864]|uniref:flagellar hook-length control protein FliK n=1 Tax=Orrella sp. JC864 TaxID=3120298 RepID=UPI00300AB9EE